jgi:hypothetical protein
MSVFYILHWKVLVSNHIDVIKYERLTNILMQLFNIPGLWLDNAVILKVSILWLKYHEIFLEF